MQQKGVLNILSSAQSSLTQAKNALGLLQESKEVKFTTLREGYKLLHFVGDEVCLSQSRKKGSCSPSWMQKESACLCRFL